MSYIATLASCLIGRIDPDDQYITIKGSSHGANKHFPIELNQTKTQNHRPLDLGEADWKEWYDKAISDFTINDVCVIKDSWFKFGRENWENQINQSNCLAIVSTTEDIEDWLYCWFNMVNKIPKHIYYKLRERSQLYPKLWKQLSKKKKLSEMADMMPIYPLGGTPNLDIPTLYVPAHRVIDVDFPKQVASFLNEQGIQARITDPIVSLHARFSEMQKDSIIKARLLLDRKTCDPAGPFDHILCQWYHSGAIGLYPSLSSLSYQSGQGMVPSKALSRSVG